jgi:hypothetical protein
MFASYVAIFGNALLTRFLINRSNRRQDDLLSYSLTGSRTDSSRAGTYLALDRFAPGIGSGPLDAVAFQSLLGLQLQGRLPGGTLIKQLDRLQVLLLTAVLEEDQAGLRKGAVACRK